MMTTPAKLLALDEIEQVAAWLHSPRRRGPNYLVNQTIFRLACCCGLRVSEICRVNLGHLCTTGARPFLPVEGTGGRTTRIAPIFDRDTLVDFAGYKSARFRECSDPTAPFLCGVSGKRLTPDLAAKRWRALMRVTLGVERAKQLSIQSGRRTFPSFAAAHGRTLGEVSTALGTRPATARKYIRMAGGPSLISQPHAQPIRFATSMPLAKSRSA